MPDDAEIEVYFDSLAEMFSEYGITKDSGNVVDVRHILLVPEGGTTDDTGATTYSEEEWEACRLNAEDLLKTWKDGDATEASFAELANTYSADPGSNTNGGLYPEITPESAYVEPFLNWCMDPANVVGATGIVKTEFGYHIMFMSAAEPQWMYYAKSQYISDRTTELVETGVEKHPIEIENDKICLMELALV